VEIVSGPNSSRLWNEEGEEIPLTGYRSDAQIDVMLRYLKERAEEPKETGRPFLCFQSSWNLIIRIQTIQIPPRMG
jgi:hypothetical protein